MCYKNVNRAGSENDYDFRVKKHIFEEKFKTN